MGKKIITIFYFISVDIDNYHDKYQIFIYIKFKVGLKRLVDIFDNVDDKKLSTNISVAE